MWDYIKICNTVLQKWDHSKYYQNYQINKEKNIEKYFLQKIDEMQYLFNPRAYVDKRKMYMSKAETSSLRTTVLSYNSLPESQNNGNPDLFKYLNRTVFWSHSWFKYLYIEGSNNNEHTIVRKLEVLGFGHIKVLLM